MKCRVVVSREALKRATTRSTRASAKLENHEVPADHVRSAAVQRFLDDQARELSEWRKGYPRDAE